LTLTSTEGVDNLVNAAGADGRAQLARVPAFAPHARIVEHARSRGLDARLTPGGDAGLIAGLLEWASSRTTSDD
jgi:uroporphyrinogen-III synthase